MVNIPPVAAFTFSLDSPIEGEEVQFRDESSDSDGGYTVLNGILEMVTPQTIRILHITIEMKESIPLS